MDKKVACREVATPPTLLRFSVSSSLRQLTLSLSLCLFSKRHTFTHIQILERRGKNIRIFSLSLSNLQSYVNVFVGISSARACTRLHSSFFKNRKLQFFCLIQPLFLLRAFCVEFCRKYFILTHFGFKFIERKRSEDPSSFRGFHPPSSFKLPVIKLICGLSFINGSA